MIQSLICKNDMRAKITRNPLKDNPLPYQGKLFFPELHRQRIDAEVLSAMFGRTVVENMA